MAVEKAESNEAGRGPARKPAVFAAGIATLLLGAAAALLPFIKQVSMSDGIGWLLLLAGLIEMGAGAALHRARARVPRLVAGAVTALAGLVFILSPEAGLITLSHLVIAWLLARGLVLLLAVRPARGVLRRWIVAGGMTDILLAVVLFAGLPVARLVGSLLGPTPELVASFAWIFAASFLVTGASLLSAAQGGRGASDPGD